MIALVDCEQVTRTSYLAHDMLAFLHARASQLKSIVSIPENWDSTEEERLNGLCMMHLLRVWLELET